MVLTVIGLVLTLIFGFLSIDLFKRKKNPGKLTLVKQTVIGLFNNIAKNFAEISIQYKGEPIKENVIYIKACFINDGDIDIEGEKIEKTLVLKLNKNLKWIKSIISKTSPDLLCNPEISQDQTELKFNFGLIRKKEFFQFEALIETLEKDFKAEDIFDNFIITHRIANTQKVKTEILLDDEQMKKKKKNIKSFGLNIGFQVLVMIGVLMVQLFYFKTAPIHYIDKLNHIYEAKATTDNKIELKENSTGRKNIITLKEFQSIGNYRPFIPNQTIWAKVKSVLLISPLFVIIFGIVIGWEYYELRKSNKIYDILSKNNEN